MTYTPELLLPAGSISRLKTALLYGADAVYAGLPSLSMRARSGFTLEEMLEAIPFAHSQGKKVYLALNLFTHNSDVERLPKFIKTLQSVKPDGVIISDPGVFDFVKTNAPELPIHISTQANVCSYLTAGYWQRQGATRCVLAREVRFRDTVEIKEKCKGLELEMFVHGAMCMSYSGRCLISSFLTGRSANKGACAHSCRWKYKFYVEEEKRPGELFPLEEDDHGSYIMNSKDMNLMNRIPEILNAGIDSLKIEGRNKSEYYVAITSHAYRHAIDAWKDDTNASMQPFAEELNKLQNRGFTEGFFDGVPGQESQQYTENASVSDWQTSGYVSAVTPDGLEFTVRNPLRTGDKIEFVSPKQFSPILYSVEKIIRTDNREVLEKTSPGGKERPILLPFESFQMPKEKLLDLLPILSVARKQIRFDGTRTNEVV